MTNLQVRIVPTPSGPKAMLADETGEALPCQRETVLRCGIEDIDTVTVTFVINQRRVSIATN